MQGDTEPMRSHRIVRRASVGALAIAAGLLLAAPAITIAQSSNDSEEFQRLFGGYALDEPVARVQERIRLAIERSTEPLGFPMREIARGRLQDNNPVIRRLRIGMRGQDVAVSTNGRAVVAPGSGATRAVELPGGPAEASYAYADGRLHQVLAYERGTRRNTFALRQDGRLVVTCSLSAEILPRPVTYRMLFRRTSTEER